MWYGDTRRCRRGKGLGRFLLGLRLQAITAVDDAVAFAVGTGDDAPLIEKQTMTEAGRTIHGTGLVIGQLT
jgi:hypothetical protein